MDAEPDTLKIASRVSRGKPTLPTKRNENQERGWFVDYLSISVSTYLTNPSFWILSAIWPTFSKPGTSMNAT